MYSSLVRTAYEELLDAFAVIVIVYIYRVLSRTSCSQFVFIKTFDRRFETHFRLLIHKPYAVVDARRR